MGADIETHSDSEISNLLEGECDAGNASSCFRLADMYFAGEGVLQNYQETAQLLERACELGSPDGCSGLGLLYFQGRGVLQDERRGFRLIRRACNEGGAEACYLLAQMYHDGTFGRQFRPASALRYFRRACDDGDHLEACERVLYMYENSFAYWTNIGGPSFHSSDSLILRYRTRVCELTYEQLFPNDDPAAGGGC